MTDIQRETALYIDGRVSAETLKRVTLELGGKSAGVVLADADDELLAKAVKITVANCFLNSGQTCTALSRLVVPADRIERAEELAAAAAAKYAPGPRLGPLVSAEQRKEVESYLDPTSGGASAITVFGGAELPERGYYVSPTVISRVDPDSRLAQEEVFGPVLAQPLPAVLGHEACGTVVETGEQVTDLELGQRVILLWITSCGHCFHCTHDEPHLCATGSSRAGEPYALTLDGEPVYPGLTVGSFAEQTVVPRGAVVAVPDDIDTADAALLGCAVTTGVGAVVSTAQVTADSSVLVIGLGGVGLSVIQGARLAGASTIIAVDRNVEKAELALAAGATHFLPADDDTKKAVRGLTEKRGADYVFDCVGSARTIRDMWSMTRRGGAATVVGIGGKDDTVSFSALELFHFARTLQGCVAGSLDAAADMPRFFDWVRSGDLDLRQLITGAGTLADVDAALDELAAGRGIRTVLRPEGA